MPQPKAPENRRRGDKSKHYTDIRRKLNQMTREESREWYRECLRELPKDSELWEWLNREPIWAPKRRGEFGNKIGRPNDIKKYTPDTRNMDWDEI